MFDIFANRLGVNYLLATCLAFIFSTFTNYVLGHMWTFKDNSSYENKMAKEIFLVFGVSFIGLMFMFVDKMMMNTPILKTSCKVISTGIVFVWNFSVRKFWIYK